jgi:hypothetical protein
MRFADEMIDVSRGIIYFLIVFKKIFTERIFIQFQLPPDVVIVLLPFNCGAGAAITCDLNHKLHHYQYFQ